MKSVKLVLAYLLFIQMHFNITPVVGVSSIAHLKYAMMAMNIKLIKKE